MASDIAEIRGMDTRELRARLHDLRKEKFNLGFRGSAEEVAKTARHRQIRRTVARIMTVLAQRELAPADAAPAREAATTGAAVDAAPKRAAAKGDGGQAVAAAPAQKGDAGSAAAGSTRKKSSKKDSSHKDAAATGSKTGKAGGKK